MTPVALDQHPGELHLPREPTDLAAATLRQAAAVARAERIIGQACRRVGLPEPARVIVAPAPLVAGSQPARRFAPFPRREGRLRRVLVHAELQFETPVAGPILLGAGRFLGLGLFRPLPVHGGQ